MTAPADAARNVIAAIQARDNDSYAAAFETLVDAAQAARPQDLEPALELLAPVLARAPLGPAAGLAQLVGAMAGQVDDTTPVLGVLAERACEAMELAARFAALHRELLGEPPPAEDPGAVPATSESFAAAVGSRVDAPETLLAAWFAGSDWAQPVLYLAQRADVRAALPHRERLLRAAGNVREDLPVAQWLHGILRVLDDCPLLVLHRPTGRGFRVTIGGIGDNFQLATLLAARLIGEPDAGWLPGTPPTPEMVAAADGSGDPQPAGGITGRFNLVGGHGGWVWNEGAPADIPVFDGERVVVLDPPPYPRSWNAGRIYPLMHPTLRVDRHLPAEEAAAWLARVRPAQAPAQAPDGWTDDLTIPLPPGRTVADLVDTVLDAALASATGAEIERRIRAEFGLSEDDAATARSAAWCAPAPVTPTTNRIRPMIPSPGRASGAATRTRR